MLRIPLLAITFSFIGCATQQQYGNFSEHVNDVYNQQLVVDAIDKISRIYAPASTRFDLQHKADDIFGETLIKIFRERGYSVHEYDPNNKEISQNGSKLSYILDVTPEINLFRVTLLIDDSSLSRAYKANNIIAEPAGAWVRKE